MLTAFNASGPFLINDIVLSFCEDSDPVKSRDNVAV